MADIRRPQQVNAYFQTETGYATIGKNTQAEGALSHIGLLDTFDPRMLDHQYAAVSTVGYSVAPHVLKGATMVTLPLKIGAWGNGWKTLLGRCIGQTTIDSAARPAYLRNDIQTVAIVAEEELASTWQGSLASGVAFNKATLDLDYTSNAPVTIDFDATAYYVVDEATAGTRTQARTFAGDFITADYSSQTLASEPTTDPILPTDVTIQYSTGSMSEGVTIDGPDGSYVEVGERFMLFYTSAGVLSTGVPASDDDSIVANGVIDLTHANADTVDNIAGLDASGWTGWSVAALGGAGSGDLTTNLQKGVYNTTSAKNIYMPSTLTDWPYVKTAKLTIDNQHIPLPGVGTSVTDSSVKKLLQNNDVARGESIITLEITSTAKDETFYDQMVTGTSLPLVRLDFDTNGSIALTNGRIMSRTAGYAAGAETTETVTMQFYGAGDYTNYSKYAISGDF